VTTPAARAPPLPSEFPIRFVWTFAGVVVACAAIYGWLGIVPEGASGALWTFAPTFVATQWAATGCRRRLGLHDAGFLFFVFSFVAIGWYLFHTRGKVGLAISLGLYGLIFSFWVGWMLGAIAHLAIGR
jgi:hypothetical protein